MIHTGGEEEPIFGGVGEGDDARAVTTKLGCACMCMYVYVCVCMYVYGCMDVWMYGCMDVYVCMCMMCSARHDARAHVHASFNNSTSMRRSSHHMQHSITHA